MKTLVFEDGKIGNILSLESHRFGANGVFCDCPLETLYLGRNLHYRTYERDGYSPFYNIETLKEVTIGGSVSRIEDNAFMACVGLTDISIPNSVKSIGDNAFSGCTSLTEMIIPNSVNKINNEIFKGCTNLRRLIVEDGAEELRWNCYSTSSDGRPFSGTSLETLYLGRNLVNDDDSPFSFIESLKDVTIGNSVERISDYAFYGCTGLTEITIPNSVTEIGDESFYGCTNLTKITISNSVTEIGYQTFAGCSNLKTIYSLNLQPPTYDIFFDPAFEQTCYSSAVLYVPIGSLNAYQTTIPWSNFGNIQEFDPVTGIDNTKMEVEAENEETTIYDLQGRRLSRSQRGINIINGKKVLVTSHK